MTLEVQCLLGIWLILCVVLACIMLSSRSHARELMRRFPRYRLFLTWTDTAMLICVGLFISFSFMGLFHSKEVNYSPSSAWDIYRNQLIMWIVIAPMAWRLWSVPCKPWRLPKIRPMMCLLWIFMGIMSASVVGCLYFMSGANEWIVRITEAVPNQGISTVFKEGTFDVRMALSVSAIVGAPIGEEILFRGFLYGYMRRRTGCIWLAALVSGLFFGVAHAQMFSFIPITLGGVMLAYVYEKTGRLWATMVIHSLWNTLGVIVVFFVA